MLQNKPRINQQEIFASTYRRAVEMLYEIDSKSDYELNILPIKKVIEELPQVSESFSTKHLSFWSRALKACPSLVIYDTRMREIIRAANPNIKAGDIKYKDFINALTNAEKSLGLDINQIERAIFAFSSNYFQNNKFVLRKSFKIDHVDFNIAKKLIFHD